jgi:hypothetical protein
MLPNAPASINATATTSLNCLFSSTESHNQYPIPPTATSLKSVKIIYRSPGISVPHAIPSFSINKILNHLKPLLLPKTKLVLIYFRNLIND